MIPASGSASRGTGMPIARATRPRHSKPLRRHSRADTLGACSGARDSTSAAESSTDSSAITHDEYGCGERNRTSGKDLSKLFRLDMELERAFVARGGLLMAGSDPVGLFGSVPGFADHREIELLVEAGFTPVQAIQIATLNGAIFLGHQDQIGSIAIGKNADLVVIKGDPATRITDIENVEVVFKDCVGYDTQKLLDAAKGHYGEF